jgi:hypothetical protein
MPYFFYCHKDFFILPDNHEVLINHEEPFFVPDGSLPIKVDPKTFEDIFENNYFRQVNRFSEHINDFDEIYVIVEINDLTTKINLDSLENNDINLKLLNLIGFHEREGYSFDHSTSQYVEVVKPSTECSWDWLSLSWIPNCHKCRKPKCPSVRILSEKMNIDGISMDGTHIDGLQDLYCDCERCEKCNLIYDYECYCDQRKQSDASRCANSDPDNHFTICEYCGQQYDWKHAASQRKHRNGNCC